MAKGKGKIFFISLVVAVAALFTAAEALAQCPEGQRSCVTPDGWTIKLLDGYPQQSPGRCPKDAEWEYRYQVCGPGTACNASGLVRVNLAIPDCCPEKIALKKASGCIESLYTFPVGAGDPLTKFEKGDQFVYAARLPYWGRIEERSFCANTASLAGTSVCLDRRLNPTLGCCKILGPACTTNEPLKANVSITQGPVEFSIVYSQGKSSGVECEGCSIEELTLNQLVLYVAGEAKGKVTWLPFDTPIQSTASPECTYVRLQTGAVKRVCK